MSKTREAADDLYRALVSEHGHDEKGGAPWPACLPVHIAMNRYRDALAATETGPVTEEPGRPTEATIEEIAQGLAELGTGGTPALGITEVPRPGEFYHPDKGTLDTIMAAPGWETRPGEDET